MRAHICLLALCCALRDWGKLQALLCLPKENILEIVGGLFDRVDSQHRGSLTWIKFGEAMLLLCGKEFSVRTLSLCHSSSNRLCVFVRKSLICRGLGHAAAKGFSPMLQPRFSGKKIQWTRTVCVYWAEKAQRHRAPLVYDRQSLGLSP